MLNYSQTIYSDSRNGQQHGKLNLISRNAKSSESLVEQRMLSNSNILCLIISSPRSHSTITVPPEIQRAAADYIDNWLTNGSFHTPWRLLNESLLSRTTPRYLSDEIAKKATNLLNLCRRNLHMCNQNIKETAYKAIIRPHLEYGWFLFCSV